MSSLLAKTNINLNYYHIVMSRICFKNICVSKISKTIITKEAKAPVPKLAHNKMKDS
jgi:hypothetical protein